MPDASEPTPTPIPAPTSRPEPAEGVAATADRAYADRLNALQGKRWKKLLNVQLPWQLHIRRLAMGRTLDVGCGNGRNLSRLDAGSVGVDHNPYSVQTARALGCEAYTVDEFFADPAVAKPGSFDSILAAHLVEHLQPPEAREILSSYLPMLRPGGRVVFFTPQERGYASDATHVAFTGFDELRQLSHDLGLDVVKHYSFPFPRFTGKAFIYNEFILIATVPQR
ncbi:class I SAM-dependent methyltransferase [Nakamurella antarctica]|uniref:Class I SAM-dependent methyltransferase n=1 Tax=Nakamurella antarctica TaxID=1902245 RepID=A0A3G8ZM80_9ACTN|nr:class I SAM-dependent methyltransferase [Nakamurella antarctica]AZI58373.1 class I SAM-dependent methyltransferase [Nakamurella antarctica]